MLPMASRRAPISTLAWALLFVGLVVLAVLNVVFFALHSNKSCEQPPPTSTGVRCPPFKASYAWSYQDPETCVETWRIGIYFNVSTANQHLVNVTALRGFYDALEPWMLQNVVPYFQRTIRVTIFTPTNLPTDDDWSPYIIHYINDVNAFQVGGCAWHWTHSPTVSSWFQLGSMADIIGPWAPLPPDGWPVISTPIGVEGGHDIDGVWGCMRSATRWGWDVDYWGMFTTATFHEIMEKLYDWNSAQFVATHTTATRHLGGTQWFIMETGDPVQFNVPMTIPGKHKHETYRICNFVLPAYFGGCLSSACGPATGPMDFLGVVTESFVPAGGGQIFVRDNGTVVEACTLVVSEHYNGGFPLVLCDALPGVASEGEGELLEDQYEEKTRSPRVFSLDLFE